MELDEVLLQACLQNSWNLEDNVNKNTKLNDEGVIELIVFMGLINWKWTKYNYKLVCGIPEILKEINLNVKCLVNIVSWWVSSHVSRWVSDWWITKTEIFVAFIFNFHILSSRCKNNKNRIVLIPLCVCLRTSLKFE